MTPILEHFVICQADFKPNPERCRRLVIDGAKCAP